MILEIPNLLTNQELQQLQQIAANSTFVDGRISNPHNKTKNNKQVDFGSEGHHQSNQIFVTALMRSEMFRNFALPSRTAPVLMCQYDESMSYGVHVDTAHMAIPNQAPLRSDLSTTIFLSDPNSYDGGELVMHLESKPVPIKLDAGSAVVYPSTTMHEVRPVTRGQRFVAITFTQSQVVDERVRNMIYSLGEVSALEGLTMKHENRVRLDSVRANLLRMHSN